MRIIYECAKLKGNRLHQSDELFVKDNIFGVADGMGDKVTSKLASKLAIKILYQSEDIEKSFQDINIEIINKLSKHADNLICGTTLSVLKLDLDLEKFYIYHVGDSKIFLIRDKSVIQLTQDQAKHQLNKKYIKALGVDWTFDLYKNEGFIEEGDIFLLSTDGICEDKDIFSILPNKTPKEIKKCLTEKFKNPEDNLSFIVLKLID